MSPETDQREFGVVVLGATGVTGRRVAAYLAERAPQVNVAWAAAGRDEGRVREAVRGEGVSSEFEIVVADVSNPMSIASLAERTKVVLNLVGPYTRFGEPVIQACIQKGAHYFDLTGEVPHVARMISRYDQAARDAGVKVVQVAGFEALPFDLSVLAAADAARDRWDEGLAEVDVVVSMRMPPGRPRATDGISGGTFQSLTDVLEDEDSACTTDPAAMLPPGADPESVRRRSPITIRPRRHGGGVVAPMAPAPFINPPVIHRTNALLRVRDGRGLGENFRYREGIRVGRRAASLPFSGPAAVALAGISASVGPLTRGPAGVRRTVAKTLRKIGPDSGFGPDLERMKQSGWRLELTATTDGGHEVRLRLDAEGHAGYLSTAWMLGEAGLILADPDADVPDGAGCLTPATALGTAELERFEHAGLRFSIDA